MLSRKKILICGGSGFIGRNMTDWFLKNGQFEVHATYHQTLPNRLDGVTYHKCDLRDPAQIERAFKNMNVVVQAAATTSGAKDIVNSPELHVTDNAVMNSYIFREAVRTKIEHLIFFSCTVMYPDLGKPNRETDFIPSEMFEKYFGVGWTKVYLEKMCEFYSNIGHTKFTAIRQSNIYGPFDKFDPGKSNVFGATVHKIMSEPNTVRVWGPGTETRDFLYVEDVCRFAQYALERQTRPFELVNIGLGKNHSVRQLVERILRLSGRNLNVEFDLSQPTLSTNIEIDISYANKAFAWRPAVELDDGILRTLNWYKDKKAQISNPKVGHEAEY